MRVYDWSIKSLSDIKRIFCFLSIVKKCVENFSEGKRLDMVKDVAVQQITLQVSQKMKKETT